MPNDPQVDDTVDAPEEIGDEPADADTTDWKAEALRARDIAKRNAGIAKRNATRLEKWKKTAEMKVETVADPVKKETKQQGFDYGEKAFLRANGIVASEYGLVQEVMQSTGKSLDEVLEAKYFQAALKEMREEQAAKDAIPSGSKRSTSHARDTVEFWIQKGEMPPRDQVELRRKVVEERIKAEQNRSTFTDNPVV